MQEYYDDLCVAVDSVIEAEMSGDKEKMREAMLNANVANKSHSNSVSLYLKDIAIKIMLV